MLEYSEDLAYADLWPYLRSSHPVVVQNIPRALFRELRDNYPIRVADPARMEIQLYTWPRHVPELAALVRRVTRKPILYLASFAGDYGSGVMHMDAMSTYNFYFVQRGAKEVFIVPPEYTDVFRLRGGIDSVYALDDVDNSDSLTHLAAKAPEYYRFVLNASQVLLFNNAKCLHKFINLSGKEEVYSLRLFSLDPSPRVALNDFGNWQQAVHYANIMLSSGLSRNASYVG